MRDMRRRKAAKRRQELFRKYIKWGIEWWIWVVVDIVTVYMWFVSFLKGQENIATLIMWMVYLVNAVIMLIKWEKEARTQNIESVVNEYEV